MATVPAPPRRLQASATWKPRPAQASSPSPSAALVTTAEDSPSPTPEAEMREGLAIDDIGHPPDGYIGAGGSKADELHFIHDGG